MADESANGSSKASTRSWTRSAASSASVLPGRIAGRKASKASAAIRHAKTDAPHHGVALELSDGSLLTTQGTQEARSTVQVRRGDTVLAQTSDCPGVHGEAVAAPTRGTKGTKGKKDESEPEPVVLSSDDNEFLTRMIAHRKDFEKKALLSDRVYTLTLYALEKYVADLRTAWPMFKSARRWAAAR